MKKLLVWAALFASATAQPEAPAPHSLTLEGRSALGDVVRFGRPFLAHVDVSVTDPALTMETSLILDETSPWEVRSTTPLKLSPGNQRVSLPYLSASYNPLLRVEGLPSGTAVSAQMTPSIAMDQDFLAVSLSPRRAHFSYLGGYKSHLKRKQGEIRVTYPPSFDALPTEWWEYLGLDAVIVHDLPNLKLSDEVEQAILGYVQSGGLLVLVSNLDPNEYRDTEFARWLPVQPAAVRQGMLTGELAPGAAVRNRKGGLPLLARRHYGCGWIYQVLAPVETTEALGSKPTAALWTEILNEDRQTSFRRNAFDPTALLDVLPELPPPATTALAWYLALYVLVAVPGIYIYLRRKDQVLRLIFAVPCTALAFSAGAYYFNSMGRGDELVLREYGVAWLVSGQTRLTCDSLAALFSPSPVRYSVDLSPPAYVRPQPEPGRVTGSAHTLSCRGRQLSFVNERLAQWGVSRWRGLSLRELTGPIRLTVKGQGGQLQAEIDNRSGLDLQNAVFVADNLECTQPAPLGAGHQVWSLPASNTYTLDSYLNDRRLQLQSDDVNTLRGQIEAIRMSQHTLLGWTEEDLFKTFLPKGLQPKQIRRTLVVVTEEAP